MVNRILLKEGMLVEEVGLTKPVNRTVLKDLIQLMFEEALAVVLAIRYFRKCLA